MPESLLLQHIRASTTLLVVLTVLAVSANARAQQTSLSAEPPTTPPTAAASQPAEDVVLKADRLTHDKERNLLIASGNVEVRQGDEVLLADELTYNQVSGEISAAGNIRLIQANGTVVFAETADLSSDFKEATIRNLRVLSTDDARTAAVSAARSGGTQLYAYKAIHSPCKPCAEDPSRPLVWQIKAQEVHVNDEHHTVEYRDAHLEFLGVPVLYTPYLSHPTPGRRKTGLLTPSYGESSDLGTFVSTPYYFNLAPERDLTVTPKLFLSGNQLHLQGDYRSLTASGPFSFTASATNTRKDQGGRASDGNNVRGHVAGTGVFDIDDTWRWDFNVARASDRTYYRRYGYGNYSFLQSDVGLEGFHGDDYSRLRLFTYQNFRADRANSRVPRGVLEGSHHIISEPGDWGQYWTADTSGVAIVRSANATDSYRAVADLGWHLPFVEETTGQALQLDASLLGAGYYVSRQSLSSGDDFTGNTGRMLPSVSLTWRYPFSRAHDTVTEIVEPIAVVRAAPNVGNNEKIPNEDSINAALTDVNLFAANRFQGFDRLEGGSRIDYGVKWGLYGNQGEYGQVFLGQSYRLRDDDTFAAGSGLDNHLSDYVGRAVVLPNNYVDLRYAFRLRQHDFKLLQSEGRVAAGPSYLRGSLSYSGIDSEAGTGNYGDRREVRSSLVGKLTDTWQASASNVYRLSDPRGSLNHALGLRYADECFTFDTTLKRSFFKDGDLRPESVFYFTLTFKNLGSFSNSEIAH